MKSNDELFNFWIEQGWKYRRQHNEHMKSHVAEYKSRIAYEAKVIQDKNFVDYFLIVSDLVRWAKNQSIAVGPGRGSGASSLICYLLRITEIDPVPYPMLFERFIDPTRDDWPDLDIDFQSDRRDEVFNYAASKYGSEYVANIGTFTRYLGKNSLDDVARVYHSPKWVIDAIKGKLIQRAEGHPRFMKSLEDTYNSFTDVADLVTNHDELNYALRLEGNLRQFGVHAAGMVISAVPLNEICATYERNINGRVGQAIPYNKYDASYLGLLKIDALSLITMDEIASICHDAGMTLEELYRIPLQDKATLEAFKKGNILGIFQFEGVTTRRVLRAVEPTTFMHLADVNALARPGADDKGYIANKSQVGFKFTTYKGAAVHPIVAQHLSWTYGVIVYEEQILMILRDLGGFEPRELNRMRKIIHDKLGSTHFNENYQRFVKGAAAHNVSEDAAKQIWDGMVSASGYAFNIAHSVSYAHIGYWQQWLKVHYPAEFFKAKLSKCTDAVKRGKFISEAERHGISVLPPDIMHSGLGWTFTKVDGLPTLMAGLTEVEGIGAVKAQAIMAFRGEIYNQQLDWEDLIELKGFGPKTIQKIIDFCESDDPFGVRTLSKRLSVLRGPNHTLSVDIPPEKTWVNYIGIVRRKKYYDAVEQLQRRTAEELSYEDALNRLEDNHLLKYAALDVEDEYGEVIKVRISRWAYPRFSGVIQSLKINTDCVAVQGYSSDFGGISIQVKGMAKI